MAPGLNSSNALFCYLDFDLNDHRAKLATVAAFVDATDSRYGFSSKVLRLLGGSELSRIEDLIAVDHEWSSRASGTGVEVRAPPAGNRIVVKLAWDVAPLACENFATLCANGSLLPGSTEKKASPAPIGESGKPLTYRMSKVHRVVPNFIIQGGDFVFGNGSGGESIFNGKKFKDERAGLNLKHDRRGILSMGNSGKNSNSSQWFITFVAAPQCDGKHVIFGEVISGWSVLDELEKLGSASGEPSGSVTITDCGVWTPFSTPGSGYWYDQPDAESYSGVSSTFMVRPRVAVLGPNAAVLDTFVKALGGSCIVTRINAADWEGASSEAAQVNRITELLERFEVDVVLVAPACSKYILNVVKLPSTWASADLSVDQVIMAVKPVEALDAVLRTSWLARKTSWQLEGTGL